MNVLGEDKGCLVTCQAGTEGRIVVSILDLGARRGWFINPIPGHFTLGKESQYPLCRRVGGPWGGSGKPRHYWGSSPGTLQPIASCYADYTIPARVSMLPVTKFILPETSFILSSIYKNAL